MLLGLLVAILPGGAMKKPWYLKAIVGGGSIACLALLQIAPFAPTKADKSLMQFIGFAVFVAAMTFLLIYNRITLGTFLPGRKQNSAASPERSSSDVANKPKASRVVTAIGLITITLLSCTAAEIIRDKHLPASNRIPFDLIMLGALFALIRMAFKYRQEQAKSS